MSDQENTVLIPPSFEPIAYLLLGNQYKLNLEQLIAAAPKNVVASDEWWGKLAAVTKAKKPEIKQVRKKYDELLLSKYQKASNTLKQLATVPEISTDQTLVKLLTVLAQQMLDKKANVDELNKARKEIQIRLQSLDEKIKEKELEKSKPLTESKQHTVQINEGIMNVFLTKIRQYLASPAFKHLLKTDEDGSIESKKGAQLIIRDLLLLINNNAYDKLKEKGLKRRAIIAAFRQRTSPKQKEVLRKARQILTNIRTLPDDGAKTDEKNTIEKMMQLMVKAGKQAEETGKDKLQAAENKLREFEESGIEDAVVVRRLWEKYLEK